MEDVMSKQLKDANPITTVVQTFKKKKERQK